MISRSGMLAITFVLCLFVQLSFQQTAGLIPPTEVLAFSAARNERYHHLFFHTTRMNYLRISAEFQNNLQNLGWAPLRPAKAFKTNGAEAILEGNDSGEDFLFMHRRMIEDVNRISREAGSSWRVTGWENCPAPGSKKYPVPANYSMPGQDGLSAYIAIVKGDDYYWNTIQPAEDALKDQDYLSSVTLGELGAKLEFEIHTWMHLRFSESNPIGYRVQNDANPTEEVDESWDDVRYNWLADFYSAHVHPTFWKIHGWIESKIESWRVANGVDAIVWKGTWEGGPMAVLSELYTAYLPAGSSTDTETDTEETESDFEVDPALLQQLVELLKQAANSD